MQEAKDIDGNIVREGSRVRVLSIRASVVARLTANERADVLSMMGEVFEVYEIDEWGSAWVEKWWKDSEDESRSHSLGLASEEMKLVPD